jgi:hypothetical protein
LWTILHSRPQLKAAPLAVLAMADLSPLAFEVSACPPPRVPEPVAETITQSPEKLGGRCAALDKGTITNTPARLARNIPDMFVSFNFNPRSPAEISNGSKRVGRRRSP